MAVGLNFIRSPVRQGLIPSLNRAKPQVLWIGCCSSGVKEPLSLGLPPEEIMVHRNIGNLLSNHDLSTQSSLEYALKVLQVQHIVICGHYGCQFVNVTPNNAEIASWTKNIGELYESRKSDLETIKALPERNRRFAELHAVSQAKLLMEQGNVACAMRERDMKVHAFVYDTEKAECVELKIE